MANEFKHKDPCSTLTQAEYIAACGDGHIFACQATGDILYASSATVLKNLGKGAAGTVLSMGCSCIPDWTTSAASATVASTVVVVDGTDTSSFVAIFDSATGSLAPKTDAGLAYNAGTGTLTATAFAGPITGNVTGNASGTALTVTQAAQGAITSLGTLTGLTLSGDATLTGAAIDVDLIDDSATALSFDSAGKAAILNIITTDCGEGVTMSGTLGVTGVTTATGGIELSHATANTLTASSGVLSIEGNRVFHACGTDIPVADGGTGASTFTANGILVGNGTSAVAVTATMATKGHVMIGDGSGVPTMLAVGTNCHVLTACCGEGTGVKWAAAAGGGDVVCDTSPQLGGNLDIQARLLVGNGGSTGIAISSAGEVTMAAQPAVLAYNSATDTNVTGNGAEATVDFDTEVFDQNADFASDTFTAPITGRYLLSYAVRCQGITTAATSHTSAVVAQNRSFYLDEEYAAPTELSSVMKVAGSAIVDMDAADTVYVIMRFFGEASDVIDIYGEGSPRTTISICLLA
jgi:hypothetical protein